MNYPTGDPAQTDLTWSGYHPRAAIPALVVAGILSFLLWTGRWYLDDLSELTDRLGALAVFALAWCVWPGIAAVYVYRTVTYTYRVTNRAVLIDFGFWHKPVPPLWLNQIVEVRAGAGWVSRLFGVGWVEVRTSNDVVCLVGVRNPSDFAKQIHSACEAAKKA